MTEDFNGNPGSIVKYGIFTLFCSSILAHLDPLLDSISGQAKLSEKKIWTDIHEILDNVYDAELTDLDEASDLLYEGICYRSKLLRTKHPPTAEVMEAIAAKTKADAPNWSYREDVERWHQAGRELAQDYYASCPYRVIRRRLTRVASLIFQWVSEAKEAPFGYRKQQRRGSKLPSTGFIVIRFAFSNRFENYLAYPFYFMHEYVSHAYAVETGCNSFADGWLLYAAYNFLKQQDAKALPLNLHGLQIDAYERYIIPSLNRGRAEEGYFNAKAAWNRIELHSPGCFDNFMHELASRPKGSNPPHRDFLHRLNQYYRRNWPKLKRWLRSAGCRVDKIWPYF